MIQLKSPREIEVMAEGGRILADTVAMLSERVQAGMTTLDLDTLAEGFIRSHDNAVPAFKGLYGFPGSICTSINEEIVHGIPSRRRVLREGDLVSIDVGVGYKGFFTDSAATVAVGDTDDESQRLLTVTVEALEAGIAAATMDNHIGDIDYHDGIIYASLDTTAGYTNGHVALYSACSLRSPVRMRTTSAMG